MVRTGRQREEKRANRERERELEVIVGPLYRPDRKSFQSAKFPTAELFYVIAEN
jgi:hypothetical protein